MTNTIAQYAIYGKVEKGLFVGFEPYYGHLEANLVYEMGGKFFRAVEDGHTGGFRPYNVTDIVIESDSVAGEMAMLFQVQRDHEAVEYDASYMAQGA